jgi:hypothetical protein
MLRGKESKLKWTPVLSKVNSPRTHTGWRFQLARIPTTPVEDVTLSPGHTHRRNHLAEGTTN